MNIIFCGENEDIVNITPEDFEPKDQRLRLSTILEVVEIGAPGLNPKAFVVEMPSVRLLVDCAFDTLKPNSNITIKCKSVVVDTPKIGCENSDLFISCSKSIIFREGTMSEETIKNITLKAPHVELGTLCGRELKTENLTVACASKKLLLDYDALDYANINRLSLDANLLEVKAYAGCGLKANDVSITANNAAFGSWALKEAEIQNLSITAASLKNDYMFMPEADIYNLNLDVATNKTWHDSNIRTFQDAYVGKVQVVNKKYPDGVFGKIDPHLMEYKYFKKHINNKEAYRKARQEKEEKDSPKQ